MTATYRVQSISSVRERASSPSLTASSEDMRIGFAETFSRVRDLLNWDKGWNGYDAAAPKPAAVGEATLWIARMYRDALAVRGEWHVPQIAADEDGDVMFEWWNGDKALTVYVSEDEVRYIKGWGLDAENEMEDGSPATPERRRALWAWLVD